MSTDVDQVLGCYADNDYTVRLVSGICRVVPFAPELPAFHSVAELVTQVDPTAKKPVLDRALEIARGDDVQRALWLFDAIDRADGGISAFSGLRAAYKLAKSESGQRL